MALPDGLLQGPEEFVAVLQDQELIQCPRGSGPQRDGGVRGDFFHGTQGPFLRFRCRCWQVRCAGEAVGVAMSRPRSVFDLKVIIGQGLEPAPRHSFRRIHRADISESGMVGPPDESAVEEVVPPLAGEVKERPQLSYSILF